MRDGVVGRYKLPFSLPRRVALKLLQKISAHSTEMMPWSPPLTAHPRYPVPFEWQLIIEYLFRERALRLPQVTFDKVFDDEPQVDALRLWAAPSDTDGDRVIAEGGYSRGVAYDLDEALAKVIGEFLERYPLTLYRDSDLWAASIVELRRAKEHFLDPYLADQFAPWQKERFPHRTFDDQSVFRFVKGESLTRNVDAYIPAQMVFLNYKYAKGEPVLRSPISNGAAGMFTYDEAVLAGLYELIQRDAFLTGWLTNSPPPVVDPDPLRHPALRDCIADLARHRLDFRILDTTSDIGVPSFAAVLLDGSGRGPAVSLGGGCGYDQEQAILRALTEALGVRSALRAWQEKRADKSLPSMTDHEPFTHDWGSRERLLLWYDRKNIDVIAPFLGGTLVSLDASRDRAFSNSSEELKHMLQLFAKRGEAYEVFVYQAHHRVLNKLGYVSVKVCVPALLPLYLRETFAPLGAKRLHTKTPNPLPHPFP